MDWKGHLKAALLGILLSSMFWGTALAYWFMTAGSLDWISWPRFAGMWLLFVLLGWWRWAPKTRGFHEDSST